MLFQVNGRLILEGPLRIYWGVRGVIHLKEDVDQRTVVTVRNKNSYRRNIPEKVETNNRTNTEKSTAPEENTAQIENNHQNSIPRSPDHIKSLTLPMKLDVKKLESDENKDGEKLYQTMPKGLSLSVLHSESPESPQAASTSDPNSPVSSSADKSKDSSSSSVSTTPTHSMGSSSSTDTLNNQGTPTKNGALRRVEYYNSLDKSSDSNQSLPDEGDWVDKGLNRSMSGPDICLQRHRSDSDTDSLNSLHFRDDDNMTMSTDSGLEVGMKVEKLIAN